MSETTPTPNIPKPSLPKPNIPQPNIPAPNLDRASAPSPISAVESGAMEAPAPASEPTFEEESSAIEYSETLLPQRILAGVIDFVVAATLMLISKAALPDFASQASTGLALGYLLFKDSLPFLNGQSLGKKVTKIQAVTTEGEPLTKNLKAGILRNITAAIPILAVIEVFILNSREKAHNSGLRLGDDFAGTKVIPVNATTEK